MSAIDLPTAFKALGDPARLRLLLLLRREELTVSELTQVLGIAQSTASGMLRVLAEAGLVGSRPAGRQTFYRAVPGVPWADAALAGERPGPADEEALASVLRAREAGAADEGSPAGLDRNHVLGRSWEALARGLLLLGGLGDVADLGVGSGELTLLLATAARVVYAVDRDEAALRDLARRARAADARVVPVLADFEHRLPLPGPVDLVVLSQSLHCAEDPERVLHHAAQALRPGGRVLVTDLLAHDEAWVRDRLGHVHLGFTAEALASLAAAAGLRPVGVQLGPRDPKPPRLRSLVALAERPASPAPC